MFDFPPQLPPTIANIAPAITPTVALRAQAALLCAKANGSQVDRLAIFDAGKPAHEQRLFFLDVASETPKLLMADWVSHGSGSDPNRDGIAETFSNVPNSNATSLGLYQVAERYHGRNPGSSYRLDGLTPGFNDNARRRAVVIHTSAYVRPGKVGRSWGCPAVRSETMERLEGFGLRNTKLWIDAEGHGLETSLSVSCPAAQAFLAQQTVDQPWLFASMSEPSPTPWSGNDFRICKA